MSASGPSGPLVFFWGGGGGGGGGGISFCDDFYIMYYNI